MLVIPPHPFSHFQPDFFPSAIFDDCARVFVCIAEQFSYGLLNSFSSVRLSAHHLRQTPIFSTARTCYAARLAIGIRSALFAYSSPTRCTATAIFKRAIYLLSASLSFAPAIYLLFSILINKNGCIYVCMYVCARWPHDLHTHILWYGTFLESF